MGTIVEAPYGGTADKVVIKTAINPDQITDGWFGLWIGNSVERYRRGEIVTCLTACLERLIEEPADIFFTANGAAAMKLGDAKARIRVGTTGNTNMSEPDVGVVFEQSFAGATNIVPGQRSQLFSGSFDTLLRALLNNFTKGVIELKAASATLPATFDISNGAGSAQNPLQMFFGGTVTSGLVYSATFDTDVTNPADLSITAAEGDDLEDIAVKWAALINSVPEWSAVAGVDFVTVSPVEPATSISIANPTVT